MSAALDAPLRCPRCRKVNIRREAHTRSAVEWFACLSCGHVWFSRPSATPVADALEAATGAKHVLIVDDEDAVVSVVTATLRDYRVTACVEPEDALAVLQTDVPVDLLLTDYLMPTMTADELVRRARAMRPTLSVLVVTGYAAAVQTTEDLKDLPILQKPFTRTELMRAVSAALAHKT